MKFTIYQESRQGGRSNNEDRMTYCYSHDALLMVVADGMGGHLYGEVAAQIAVQSMASAFRHQAQPRLHDPFLFLQTAMGNAHQAILDYAKKHALNSTPRTTCVACIVQDSIAYWVHAGDSRLFLMRNGQVVAQTRDHSRIRIMLEEGLISPEQAASHPDRNKVYSCLGGPTLPEIEFSRKTTLDNGDIILLCTDGLWGVTAGEMLAIALNNNHLLSSAPLLMANSEVKAGPKGDNLTMVAVRWEVPYHQDDTTDDDSFETTASNDAPAQAPVFDPVFYGDSDLSDAEIALAIEKVRQAIAERSSK